MSRTKSDSQALDLAIETVDKVDVGNSKSADVLGSTYTVAKKIGVVRYLQLYPQTTYVDASMRFQYKSKACTVEEWHKLCAKVKKTLGVEE